MIHIISGGGGFIGSALCNKLYKQGHQVIAFDNFSRRSHLASLNQNILQYDGDVRNPSQLNDCLTHYHPDVFWHLAYINGTKTFYSNPDLVLEVGVKGAINSIDACVSHQIKNYFLVSSSEVYNEPLTIPTPETEKLIIPDVYNPRFSYSGGKIISELLTIHYATRHLSTKIFRPHNIYGPNMGLEHVIPELVKKIVQPESPRYIDGKLVINIQGTGEETRSFCYIDDAVNEMILASIDNSSDVSPTYNIGVENEISINQLIYTIAEILKIPITIETGLKTQGSTNRRCPDMSKLNQLGYIPQYTLFQGLETTVNWYAQHWRTNDR